MRAAGYVLVAVAVVLGGTAAAFVPDATAGQRHEPVSFDDVVETGMTQVELRQAEASGYAVPRAQAFYSQYRYVVGYHGVTSLVDDLSRERHAAQFGRPLTVSVTDYADESLTVTEGGYLRLPESSAPGWVAVEDATFVVGSEARTTAGPAVVPFSDRGQAAAFADEHGGRVMDWLALREQSFGGGPTTRAAHRERVENRSRWADRTVAATDGLLDRPVSVVVGEDAPTVRAAVEQAPPNTTVRIPAGSYATNVTVDKPLTLRGEGDATRLDGGGNGTVVRATAPRVAVAGLSIAGVGANRTAAGVRDADDWDERVELAYGRADAAVLFVNATGSLAADLNVSTPANGVVFRDSDRSVLRDSRLRGPVEQGEGYMLALPMRSRVVVQDSTFRGGRDAVYAHRAHGLVVRDSEMRDVRFGVHEMYTSDSLVRDNAVRNADIGVVVMTRPTGNAVVGNDVRRSDAGTSVAGSDSYVAGNTFADNEVGMYVAARQTTYARNVVAHNDVATQASTLYPTNVVAANDFVGNDRFVVSTLGPLRVWSGNYWQGAPGSDADGDGVLERSFRPTGPVDGRVDATGTRTLAVSPVVSAVRQLQDAVPAMRPTDVVDDAPLAEPVRPDAIPSANATDGAADATAGGGA